MQVINERTEEQSGGRIAETGRKAKITSYRFQRKKLLAQMEFMEYTKIKPFVKIVIFRKLPNIEDSDCVDISRRERGSLTRQSFPKLGTGRILLG